MTVALGGEGADELFGGYPRYRWLERARRARAALPDGRRAPGSRRARAAPRAARPRRAASAARSPPAPMLERNLDWVTASAGHRARRALRAAAGASSTATRVLADAGRRAPASSTAVARSRWLMHLDQVHYLPDDVLVKTDRAGMLASLEIRTVVPAARARRASPPRSTPRCTSRAAARRCCARCCRDGAARRRVSGATARPPSGCPPPSGCAARSRATLREPARARHDLQRGLLRRAALSQRARRASTSPATPTTAIGSGRCSRSGCGSTASMGVDAAA